MHWILVAVLWSAAATASVEPSAQHLGVPRVSTGQTGVPPEIESIFASSENKGLPTYLDAEGTDADGSIVLWNWDFESDGIFDHASSIGPGAFFVYPLQGQYQASLRATDDMGMIDLAVVDVTVEPPSAETVTDADGNVYQTVTLGNQTWMIENLKTTTFRDGTPITEYTPATDWHTAFAQYQWGDTGDLGGTYDPELPFDYYGAMYNDAAIASGLLAPEGWRIPSEQDWLELIAFLANGGFGGDEAAALKTTFGWATFVGNGVDAYGFRGLPGGYVSAVGTATGAPVIAVWATSDTPTPATRLVANLYDDPTVLLAEQAVQLGAAVRCVKDAAEPVPTVSEWGLVVTGALLIIAGAGVMQRRRDVPGWRVHHGRSFVPVGSSRKHSKPMVCASTPHSSQERIPPVSMPGYSPPSNSQPGSAM